MSENNKKDTEKAEEVQKDNLDKNLSTPKRLLYENERKRLFINATRIIHDYCFCKFRRIK